MTASPWPRPVPLVGDATSAAERAGDPAAWAMPEHAGGLYAVVGARRDVRRYRPDPVPADVLERVLAAGHAAPSVGHSQPWRFLVVRDPATRDRAAVLTDRERLRQAAQLEPDAARRLLDLQLEGVREAPLGIVVCCDRRTPAAGVLGRATFPDADLWSCAAAIQNLWLAARAEGLGMGWVTLFRPDELAGLVGLPDGVVTLGWLCLGWPDERPPAPGLERAGWSRRLPLSAVVVEDRWPADDGGPPAPPSHLRAPGRAAVVGARDQADRLLTPPGSLGVLDRAVDRVVALGRGDATGGTLVLAAADHPAAALGVSAYEARVTRDVARAALAGVSVGATAAAAAGLATVVVDAGVAGGPLDGAVDARPAGPRGDLAGAAAMVPDDVDRLLTAGRVLGRDRADAGLVALGEAGVGNTTVAAALAAGLLGADAADVTGLGAGADSAVLERKRAVVTAALARAGRGLDRDPARALAELGGPELTVLAGVLLGAAEAGAAVVLDGFAVSVAALAAVLLEPGAQAALVAGQRSRERGHDLVLQALGLEPLLDLRLRAGEGAGAALAAGLLLDGLRIRRGTTRVG
ncbi:cob(II)yrinic acid a,c-diamide reductase [Geodermatophilus dictyosporus]|uniref:Nicotinate-nucleotide--dimethylbenzimidazole phosphoribosyltransferase n=1 Tax=Geodermatophilus dictyosporus TaxID=1523247 RepID=A0A1I5S5Y0_9ACTN|nr:5,6-dimethylbenzimidazole synthase [Geodermatophilus dictyosporus]SFP66077.1 cob(II)yrinic acid a,c-diamide reductase [Geodermatophilus dictyosporus]